MSPPDDRDPKPSNDTIPAPPFDDFGEVDVVPPSTVPPIPRGQAQHVLLAAFANLAHALGEAEAIAVACARALDATAT